MSFWMLNSYRGFVDFVGGTYIKTISSFSKVIHFYLTTYNVKKEMDLEVQ